jgi:hypothetical protein
LSACLHFTLLLQWTRIDQKEVFNVKYRGISIKKVVLFFLKVLNYNNFINIIIAMVFILRITDVNSKHCGIAIYKDMLKQHEVYHLALAVFV